MMVLPQWAFYGLASAFLSAALLLIQERLKINGIALAFWNKTFVALILLPFVIMKGLPSEPLFYLYLGIGAAMYAISDVIFFNGVGKEGAGAVSRILPASVIISFLLWFLIKPALLSAYLEQPAVSALILLALCLSVFFAMRLKKCGASMRALRSVWFVVFAASVGPALAKLVTLHAPISQGPFAYGFCEAIMMMGVWLPYLAFRKTDLRTIFFSRTVLQGSFIVGTVSALILMLHVSAYYYADNPAYVPAIRFLDAAIILGFYKLTGRKSQGDVASGLGVVACAAALILLKSKIVL